MAQNLITIYYLVRPASPALVTKLEPPKNNNNEIIWLIGRRKKNIDCIY